MTTSVRRLNVARMLTRPITRTTMTRNRARKARTRIPETGKRRFPPNFRQDIGVDRKNEKMKKNPKKTKLQLKLILTTNQRQVTTIQVRVRTVLQNRNLAVEQIRNVNSRIPRENQIRFTRSLRCRRL